jgi:hypothetical protein
MPENILILANWWFAGLRASGTMNLHRSSDDERAIADT